MEVDPFSSAAFDVTHAISCTSIGTEASRATHSTARVDRRGVQLDSAFGDPLRGILDDSVGLGRKADAPARLNLNSYINTYHLKQVAKLTGQDDLMDNATGLQTMCLWLVRAKFFDLFFCALVVVDILLTAAEIDHQSGYENFFGAGNLILFWCFSLELLIRITAEPARMFKDWMLIADIGIVVTSMVNIVIWLVSITQYDRVQVPGSFYRALRILRLGRLVRMSEFAASLYVLRTLTQAICESFKHVCIVISLTGLTVFAFAIVMTALVPAAAQENESAREDLIHRYGSVGRSAVTLLEGMGGASDWGTDVAFELWSVARRGSMSSGLMLTCMLLAYFFLRLGLNGLVTAIFLEQLFLVSDQADERIANGSLYEQHQVMELLSREFSDLSDDRSVTWQRLKETLEENPKIQRDLVLSIEEAEQLFLRTDEDNDGVINYDDFVFAVFRLRAMTKSVDMMSIDYQQEKALNRIARLDDSFRMDVAGIQSRLCQIAAQLPILEKTIDGVRTGIEEVQTMEKELEQKRKSRNLLQLGGDTGETVQPGDETVEEQVMSVADLRGSFELNRRLCEVEALVASLSGADAVGGASGLPRGTPEDVERHIGVVADSIVHSLQATLHQELSAVRKAAAEHRQRQMAEAVNGDDAGEAVLAREQDVGTAV